MERNVQSTRYLSLCFIIFCFQITCNVSLESLALNGSKWFSPNLSLHAETSRSSGFLTTRNLVLFFKILSFCCSTNWKCRFKNNSFWCTQKPWLMFCKLFSKNSLFSRCRSLKKFRTIVEPTFSILQEQKCLFHILKSIC